LPFLASTPRDRWVGLDATRRVMTTRPASTAAATAVAAGEEGDDDVKEGSDAVDDSGQHAGDAIDNGHQAVADGAQQVLNLFAGAIR
jgi:hypothetical protein